MNSEASITIACVVNSGFPQDLKVVYTNPLCKYRLHRGLHTQTCNHTILQLTIQLQQRGYHVSLITYLCIDYNVYAYMECSLFTYTLPSL